jgi:superfamily II DNA or RNA helicase
MNRLEGYVEPVEEIRRTPKKRRAKAGVSRVKPPAGMALDEWQAAIRREDAQAQKLRVANTGKEPVFSEYRVSNPLSGGRYQVSIRGHQAGDNRCSCPDYLVNGLGTCKHIERVLHLIRRDPRNRSVLLKGFHPPYSEVYLRYTGVRDVVLRKGVHFPDHLGAFAAGIFGLDGVLKPGTYGRLSSFQAEVNRAGVECRFDSNALHHVARVLDDDKRRRRIAEAFPRGSESAAFDGLLRTSLYPYQREGALFAACAGRCLIADEMGLGKTIQAIAAAEILSRIGGLERTLVVCPTSLKHQWKDEIAKFTGREAVVVGGGLKSRQAAYASPGFYKIVNYDVLHRDLKAVSGWGPGLIILDEAQRIKNWRTRAAKAAKKLESDYAVVLTGTPLENRLEELHSIVEFVDRFHLGPAFRFLAAHQLVDGQGRVTGYRSLSKIAETLRPILLRRTKKGVLGDLPQRLEKSFYVPLTEPQARIHEENREMVARIISKWRKRGFLTEVDQLRLRAGLQNMRMACNSTYLVDHKTDHGTKADELATLLDETFEEEGVKAVVFSQWLRTHELIERRIKGKPWSSVLFHGSLTAKERAERVRRFKEDPACRLFLSTDAGGAGLNLQNASVVVNMDQPWNPAILEQRIGRVHRLGQKRSVRVVHFIAEGSIEQGMLSIISFKKSVFAGVLDGGEDEVSLGQGGRFNRFMETVEKATEAPGGPPDAAKEGPAKPDRAPQTVRRFASKGKLRKTAAPTETGGVPAPPTHASPAQSWIDLLEAGIGFMEKLESALREEGNGQPASPTLSSFVAEDPQTGKRYLKLPMPEPRTLERVTRLLKDLAGKKQG